MSVASASLKDRLGDLAITSHEAPSQRRLFETFADRIAQVLGAEFVEVLEYLKGEEAFAVRCARGLPEEFNDRVRVPGGLLSQAGRAFLEALMGAADVGAA